MTQEAGDPCCLSCGSQLHGSYCSQCGERALREGEYSLREFLLRSFGEMTNLDGKFFRSFKLLGTRPGFLTREFIAGRRKAYLRPIQLFLVANIIYFFVQPVTGVNVYTTSLQSHMSRQIYSDAQSITERVEARVAHLGVELEDYEERFNARSSKLFKGLIIVMVPLAALSLSPFFWSRRRFFLEHLVFACHYFAWNLLYLSTIFMLLLRVFRSFVKLPHLLVEWIWIPFMFVYLYSAALRFYGEGRLRTAVQCVILVILLFGIILLYRLLLFWTVFLTIG